MAVLSAGCGRECPADVWPKEGRYVAYDVSTGWVSPGDTASPENEYAFLLSASYEVSSDRLFIEYADDEGVRWRVTYRIEGAPEGDWPGVRRARWVTFSAHGDRPHPMPTFRELAHLIDALPRREVRLGDAVVPSWRVAAACGAFCGVGVGLGLAATIGIPLTAALSAAVASGGAYLLIGAVRRRLVRRDEHVLLDGLVIALATSAPVYHLAAADLFAGLDVHVVGFSAMMTFGRLGCLANGCCYGLPATFGILYPPGFPVATGGSIVRRLPVQLLESGIWAGLTMLGCGLAVARSPGVGAGTVLAIYAIARFGMEGLRGDPRRKWSGASQSRWMAAPLLVFGLWLADRGAPAQVGIVGLGATVGSLAIAVTRRSWPGPPRAAPVGDLEEAGRRLAASAATSPGAAWSGEEQSPVVRVRAHREGGWLVLHVSPIRGSLGDESARIRLEAVARGMGLSLAAVDPTRMGPRHVARFPWPVTRVGNQAAGSS